MENITTQIEKDFNSCKLISDYENFVLKYNPSHSQHPLVIRAKSIISERVKELNSEPNPIIIILLALAAIALGVFLFIHSFSYDGASATCVYHGEHGDYKTTNWETLLGGPVSLFGGLILACGGLYFLIMAILNLTSKK